MAAGDKSKQEVEIAIRRVLDYVAERLDETITPSELAEVAGYSRHHFHRLFRQIVGESAMDYVRRLRMERAASRLRSTNWAIGIIGLESGYFVHEVFTRIFRDYFGMSPLEYRRSKLNFQVPSSNDIHFGTSVIVRQPWTDPASNDVCQFHFRFTSLEAALTSVIQCLQIVVETAYGPDDFLKRVP